MNDRAICVSGAVFEGHGNAKHCSVKCRVPEAKWHRILARMWNA